MVLWTPGASAADNERKYGNIRLGPVYLSLRIAATAGFDSNVYNAPEAGALSDRSVSLTPSVQAVLPVTRYLRFRGTGAVVPQYFRREKSERHTDLHGSVLAEADVGPLTAFGGFGAGRYRQRFTLEIDDRLQRRQRSNQFGGRLRLGQRATIGASQTSVHHTFEPGADVGGRPVDLALDRDTVTRSLELSIPLTRRTSFVPRVDFVEDRFLHSAAGLPSMVGSRRYVAALEFSDLAFFNGRFAVGVRHYGRGEGVQPYDGLFLAVNLSSPFFFGSRLALASGRDVTYSPLAARDAGRRTTYVATNHRAEVGFDLPWSLLARPLVGYSELRYLVPDEAAEDGRGRRDHVWTYGGALLRRFGSHVALGGTVERLRRGSPLGSRRYQGTVYGLAAEVQF